jgi:hypothetical protein
LVRENAVSAGRAANLSEVLDAADAALDNGRSDSDTASQLRRLAEQFAEDGGNRLGMNRDRHLAIADTLNGIADKL